MTYQLTSLAIGLVLAAAIMLLVRRAHLHGPHALWWLGLAAAIILLGTWPRLTDLIAPYLGVSYPPIVAVILGFALVLVKMMSMDLERSRQEQGLRRLAQRLALLEARIESISASAPEAGDLPDQPDPRKGQDPRE
ncbi:MAG: DUF2304 domain-containing protein [Chromatiaceae bacterium]|nr:DUF2304 domain-containing protein [Chromatiaceae bacterium]